MKFSIGFVLTVFFFTQNILAQYPRNYFRNPLNIPMQLVANFGEIRTNHWHMGLDIRTRQKVNLPVYAAADGFISRVSVEPGGFGQAVYIDHPNGYTTLYAHLNSFFPALAAYVKEQQYAKESWRINLVIPPNLFPVKKGSLIALSGSTGASEGPHVHFEIRDTKTENCLNPLLFGFPIADAVPPTIIRLAMYDRSISTYAQSPQLLSLKKTGSVYSIPGGMIRVAPQQISFAIAATDRFSGTPNPNGIYSAAIFLDGQRVSGFDLDDISYNDTRYINAQLDFPYKSRGGASLQHITPLPGAQDLVYETNGDGVIHLPDLEPHEVMIEVKDANGNTSKILFKVQRDNSLAYQKAMNANEQLLPGNVNVFESDDFELFTTEKTIYDTVNTSFKLSYEQDNAISPLFSFLNASIPAHDSVTVRIKVAGYSDELKNRIIIKNISGTKTFVQKAQWQNGWVAAKFRQFGTYRAYIDTEPPTINSPSTNLSKASRIVFIPKDNFNVIKSFRAELDGQWLRFTNDKGKSWIYTFDEKFPRGEHELKITIEDEAGNETTRVWNVKR